MYKMHAQFWIVCTLKGGHEARASNRDFLGAFGALGSILLLLLRFVSTTTPLVGADDTFKIQKRVK